MNSRNHQNKERGRASFLEAMSRMASTVSVITTDGTAGRAGVTVSSLVSVSADSPLPTLLVCIHKSSATCSVILKNGVFCANVLRSDQQQISEVFAGRIASEHTDRFAQTDWVTENPGSPRLINPLAAFECLITHSELVGQHQVIFGEVYGLFIGSHDLPLIYANRAYGTSTAIPNNPAVKAA